jgi:hypothetical protein
MADAAAEEACFASLPPAVALVIFALLPLDQRMRCAEVCRGWRDALTERSLWLRLDLSEASGGLARPASEGVLLAAAARTGGQLRSLNVAKCPGITQEVLLAVLTANAGALRQLRAWHVDGADLLGFVHVEPLLRAAPQLRVFDTGVACDSMADAQRLLRNEGAFAPLRLRTLRVSFDTRTEAAVLSLAADAAAHASLVGLFLENAPLDTPAALDAIVAVALAKRFIALAFGVCRLSPASAPALARVLGSDALRALFTVWNGNALLDAAAAAVLGDALRANCTLDVLMLANTALWGEPAAASTLLGAVTAHCSLREVSLSNNRIGDAQDAAGTALGALVAANSPALLILDLRDCGFQEAALGPLVDALAVNTHLRTLWLGTVTASAEFLRERVLPAVHANASLARLVLTVTGEGESAAREAHEIVNSRAAR